MGYSNNPQFSTYKTTPIKFDGTDLYRSGDLTVDRDLQIWNMFYDRMSQENKTQESFLKKRSGLAASSYSLSKAVSSDVLRGSYYDVDQNAFYWAVNNKVYSVTPDVGATVRTVTTLATSSGYVGFCSYLKSDAVRYVVFSDGTELWLDAYATTTCTKVTAPDLPTPHQPYPIYIDGYILLIKTNTGDIYNSNVDDPFAWTAGDFISAEISSDYAIRLVKAKNYIVCLGLNSIEYFYDAANPSGSPLSRNDSPVRSVGYVTGLCTIGDTTYFVGQDEKSNLAVFSVNSFKVEPVSNAVVNRTLQAFSSTSNVKGNVNLNQDAYCVSVDGHTFYVLRTPQTTWVYDVMEKFWYEWKGTDNTGLKIEASWGMYNGAAYIAVAGQSNISIMSPTVYQDFGANFKCRYVTEPVTLGTYNWKTCHKAHLACDQHLSTGTSNVVLSWTDKDWSDGGTGTREINLFSQSPFVTRLGRFRTRSWKIEYSDNYPLRMMGLETDNNVGSN